VIDESLVWRVEQACFNAWPALKQVHFGDWTARFGNGLSRRNNSANPLRPRPEGLERHLADIVAVYRRWSLKPRFRVLSFLPSAIVDRLEAEGFAAEAETLSLFTPMHGISALARPDVEIMASPTPEWIAERSALAGYSPWESQTFAAVVGQMALPSGFATLRDEGEAAAAAFGVVHDGLLCLGGVVTNTEKRGRGLGGRLLSGLIHWGALQGAQAVCLQVQADNAPAVALYRRLGVTIELYRYHYRTLQAG
jgi:ribosomal protein S18 acetylase RimI-like enzyme